MVGIGGLEPLATLPSIPALPQPHQPSIFIANQRLQDTPDYRRALAEALRAVNVAGQALEALAQALERCVLPGVVAGWPPGGPSRAPDTLDWRSPHDFYQWPNVHR
jgi:hypothetical protein